ncbi:hypothetical protein JCM10003_3386 [Bacteroides pyogenes JCM 10003]|nr:hypothetical protein JCM10003_3386 [Bacteroides pyogenes JCM 10003]
MIINRQNLHHNNIWCKKTEKLKQAEKRPKSREYNKSPNDLISMLYQPVGDQRKTA